MISTALIYNEAWFIFEIGLNIQGVPKTLQFLLHPGDITNYNDSIWYINYIDPHGKLGAAATHRGTHPTPAPGQACLKNPNIMPIQTHPNKITIFVFFGFIVFFSVLYFWEGEKVSKRLCTESAFTVHGIPWLVRWTGMVCFPDHSLPSCFGGFLGVGHKLLSWLCYLRLN